MRTAIQETRWIVLIGDGSHSTIGRNREPDEADLIRASEALERTGQPGWLAFLEGIYYASSPLKLRQLRRLTDKDGNFDAAVAAFLARREAANTHGPQE